MSTKILRIGFAITTAFVLIQSAAAQTWVGGTADWNTASNWSPANVPDSNTEVATFVTSGSTVPTLGSGTTTIQLIQFTGNTNFTITGLGSGSSTLRIDPNTALTANFLRNSAGTSTNQTFSALTFDANDSNTTGQTKFLMSGGKTATFDSTSVLNIAANNNLLLERSSGSSPAVLTINGALTSGAGATLNLDGSGAVLNLNFGAGSSLSNLSFVVGGGGVINLLATGDYGAGVLRGGGDNATFNVAASGITINNRTLNFHSGATGITGVSGTLAATYASGTSTYAGPIILAGHASLAKTNVIDVASGASLVLSGALSGGDATRLTVNKTGAGTLILGNGSGNTFSGTAFNVTVGTLIVSNTSNSATGSAVPLNISSGATLAGTGRVTGATTISGILAPGNSIGILTVDNLVTWNGGASATPATDWKFELGASNTADLLNITNAGTGQFLKGTGSVFRFDFQGSTALGTFKVVDWANTSNIGGGALGTSFAISDFSFTNLGNSNTGTFQFNGSQLEFIAVVPEPTTWALCAGSLAVIMLFRRRSGR